MPVQDTNVTVTTGLVDTNSKPTLFQLVASHLDAAQFVTHRSRLDQMMEAYDVFERAADTDAIEVASNG